jgi:hypothetical protein
MIMRRGVVFLSVALVLIGSCSRRSSFPPVGSYSSVMIVTETGQLDKSTENLVRQIQHPVDYYTKEELQFKAKLVPAYQVEKESPAKNMILFGLVRQGEVGRLIEGFIGTASVRKVLEGKINVFRKLDYPYAGQLTIIITAASSDQLAEVVSENGALIREIIEEANRDRLRSYLLQKEKRELTEEIRAKYKFTLRVPFLYELNQERKDIPGIEFVRTAPHRGLTVSWRSWPSGGASLADSSSLYDIRAELAWKMYDKDVMRRDLVSFAEDRLGDYDIIRMDGYWENSEGIYGGPYSCFFLYDDVRSRLWIIDMLVYGPGFDKHPLLRELRAVAETFKPD